MTQPETPTPLEVAAGTGVTTPASPAVADKPVSQPEPRAEWTPQDAAEAIAKLRSENASWRKKYGEAEPILKAHQEAEEAAKTETQRATERATAAESALELKANELNVLRAAHKHGVLEEDLDLLGSGTPEELDARAARIAARYPSSTAVTPPPSDRPVEGLRPGASPTPPAQPDTSYPESWRPAPPRGRT